MHANSDSYYHWHEDEFEAKHGITVEHRRILCRLQGYMCRLCRTGGIRLCVDRDLTCCPLTVDTPCGLCTRGMLCHSCLPRLRRFHTTRYPDIRFLYDSLSGTEEEMCLYIGIHQAYRSHFPDDLPYNRALRETID